MRVGPSRTAPEPRNLSSTEPHSPRLRNPNQLRRGERYPLHTAPKWGQSWTPIEGQSSTPIDTVAQSFGWNRSCPFAALAAPEGSRLSAAGGCAGGHGQGDRAFNSRVAGRRNQVWRQSLQDPQPENAGGNGFKSRRA